MNQQDPMDDLIKNAVTANNLYLINKAVEKQVIVTTMKGKVSEIILFNN